MINIPFSPPDITDLEINEVIDTLKSGWITTGPKTKTFEKMISEYCGTDKTICLNSATAGLELILRLFEIGYGDEVITTPYTYAATSNIILHTGAKPVFVDIENDGFNIDPKKIAKAINRKTKAIITVDFAGYPCDYDEIINVIIEKKKLYKPKKNTLQCKIDRPLLISDCAHSFGASYKNKYTGNQADFSVFSFHAVKNLTTAEGGAITFNGNNIFDIEDLYKKLSLLSLHGQNKDALAKLKAGNWKYNIEIAGYKCNMTDISAAIGMSQLKRFSQMQENRKSLYSNYVEKLKNCENIILPNFNSKNKDYCFHLMPIRINKYDEDLRNKFIQKMADIGINLNVHFIPVTMHSAYIKLGYRISSTPIAYSTYVNEVTLPLYPTLSFDKQNYIIENILNCLNS